MRLRNKSIANQVTRLLDALNKCLENGRAELLQNDWQTKHRLFAMLLKHGVHVYERQPKRLKANQRELERAELLMKGELPPLLESAL
jgi:hypothetical protein